MIGEALFSLFWVTTISGVVCVVTVWPVLFLVFKKKTKDNIIAWIVFLISVTFFIGLVVFEAALVKRTLSQALAFAFVGGAGWFVASIFLSHTLGKVLRGAFSWVAHAMLNTAEACNRGWSDLDHFSEKASQEVYKNIDITVTVVAAAICHVIYVYITKYTSLL